MATSTTFGHNRLLLRPQAINPISISPVPSHFGQ